MQQALNDLAAAQEAEAQARKGSGGCAEGSRGSTGFRSRRRRPTSTRSRRRSLSSPVRSTPAAGEYTEFEILLESQDPGQFASQLNAVRRQAQNNSGTLDRIVELKQELRAKLAQLAALEASAKRARRNRHKCREGGGIKNDADAAQQRVQQIISQRQSAVAEADANRAKLKTIYL